MTLLLLPTYSFSISPHRFQIGSDNPHKLVLSFIQRDIECFSTTTQIQSKLLHYILQCHFTCLYKVYSCGWISSLQVHRGVLTEYSIMLVLYIHICPNTLLFCFLKLKKFLYCVVWKCDLSVLCLKEFLCTESVH